MHWIVKKSREGVFSKWWRRLEEIRDRLIRRSANWASAAFAGIWLSSCACSEKSVKGLMLWARNGLPWTKGKRLLCSKDGCSCAICIQRGMLGLRWLILSLRPLILAAELTHEEHGGRDIKANMERRSRVHRRGTWTGVSCGSQWLVGFSYREEFHFPSLGELFFFFFK